MEIIEDLELRNLFKIESAEHLLKLEAGLLYLETNPDDLPRLQEVFREAHSLKGSARMLGLIEIQTQANTIEDMLGDARSGKLHISAEIIKPQLATLDLIRRMVAEVVGDTSTTAESTPLVSTQEGIATVADKPTDVDAPINSANESALAQQISNLTNQGNSVQNQITPISVAAPVTQSPQDNPLGQISEFHIDTLRVDAKKLDFLLAQAGELVVSRSRIMHWQSEFDLLLMSLENGHISHDKVNSLTQLLRTRLLEDSARLSTVTEEIEAGIRGLRLLPISTLLEQFPRMVHDLAFELNKKIDLQLEGESTVADKRIIEDMKAPLMHMLRNAVDHGIEIPSERITNGKSPNGTIRIKVSQDANHVKLEVHDDGRGLDLEAIRQQAVKRHLYNETQAAGLDPEQLKNILMTPGFSTNKMITDISGRGVGLDVVRKAVERMHGTLQIDSETGKGMSFTLCLPVSLTSTRVMLISEWGEQYALPCEAIYFARTLKPADLIIREDRQCFYHNDEVITVSRLGELLERAPLAEGKRSNLVCVVLKVGETCFGVLVDALRQEEEIVLKPPSAPIKRVRNVSGVTVLDSGLVCVVLNANDLAKSVQKRHQKSPYDISAKSDSTPLTTQKSLLLVEDSIVTRIQEKRILEAAGYEVTTAVDGLDAWDQLTSRKFDAVISDIMMPNITGLELTVKIRGNRKLSELPVILVTSLATEEDRRKGLEAGADAYISKADFDQTILLDSIARLI
jgi:two-component system chemotaxis sensor kinase CheA